MKDNAKMSLLCHAIDIYMTHRTYRFHNRILRNNK